MKSQYAFKALTYLSEKFNEGPVLISEIAKKKKIPLKFLENILLELKKGAHRKRIIQTEAFEYNYMIKGKAEYHIEEKSYIFSEGESLFFDSRLGHRLANIGDTDALMLVVYFFITDSK